MTSGTLVIWSFSRLDNGTRMPCRMGSTGVRAPVWTASGMGHWKRVIKIAGGTDCYYCINDMTCLVHICYLVIVHATLSDILLLVYLLLYLAHVILSVVAYDSCTCLLCIAYMLFSVYLADIITVLTQHCIMVIWHMPMCCISITSPLDNNNYYIHRIWL